MASAQRGARIGDFSIASHAGPVRHGPSAKSAIIRAHSTPAAYRAADVAGCTPRREASVNALLALSRAIDAHERAHRPPRLLAGPRGRADQRRQRDRPQGRSTTSSNAFLEMQWYLFSAVFLLVRRLHAAAQRARAHRHHRRPALARARRPGSTSSARSSSCCRWRSSSCGCRGRCSCDAFTQQRDLDQRRRPHPLAGAAAGAGRLPPADRCRASPSSSSASPSCRA